MTLLEVLAMAVGLALDAFAVSLAAGAAGHTARLRPAVRLSFHLGLFQFMMPVIGWYLGVQAAEAIRTVDHLVAFALLAFVGGRMIHSGLRPDPGRAPVDASRGWAMVTVSVATSLDALAIGLSLAMIGVRVWGPSVVIGLVTWALSFAGTRLGGRVGPHLGPRAELAGGIVLVAIGVRILIAHTGG